MLSGDAGGLSFSSGRVCGGVEVSVGWLVEGGAGEGMLRRSAVWRMTLVAIALLGGATQDTSV